VGIFARQRFGQVESLLQQRLGFARAAETDIVELA